MGTLAETAEREREKVISRI